MLLTRLRIKIANFIAPEIKLAHAAAIRSLNKNAEEVIQAVQSNARKISEAQISISNNFGDAVVRANCQAEALYYDTYNYMPDEMRQKWVALLGSPQPGATPSSFGSVKQVPLSEIKDFGEL